MSAALGALIAAMIAAAPVHARAEAARADPIDTTMQNCFARADRSTTAGQVQCIDAARDAWQAAIDGAMRGIQNDAPDSARRAWDESQKRWLAWRKEEALLVHAVFETTRGSAYSITQANVLLQSVRDRALAVRHAASRFAPPAPPAAASSAASGPAASAASGGGVASAAAATSVAARAQSDDARAHNQRMRPCTADAACEHAQFDLRRYTRALRDKLPAHARPVLARAQRAWTVYFDATAALGTEAERADLIGERVATVKRLSETVGND
ncbi:MAG: DUF1311 domain-containing protein [Burkholderiales bacterium]|nr:DUF1311 domain-containing protein [Burkholderiales bacterium]